jgi:divinyl chlorophyllide a 8-vinyl-reductase
MFGDGQICKANAISEADLAIVMADCITNKDRWNKILPVGGPGKLLLVTSTLLTYAEAYADVC